MRKLRAYCFSTLVLFCGCSTIGSDASKENNAELEAAEKIYQSGNIEEAKKAYENIVNKDNKAVQANYRLGNIAFKQSRYEDAEKYFTQAVNVAPRFEKAHYNLAVTHLILAENHFKYFVATASENTDIEKVGKIIADIDRFSFGSENAKSKPQSSLEKISGELKGQGVGEE